ncbi:MAG: peptidase domain-containing ABC transporter [Burkholderiaceae bacterium]|nr:peptidase domain-containing ABC transporter [Burkholderiaceae bacterium]
MSRSRLLRRWPRRSSVTDSHRFDLPLGDIVWALGSVCAVNRQPFDADLLVSHLPAPPLTTDDLVRAARTIGLRIKRLRAMPQALGAVATGSCLVVLREQASGPAEAEPSGAPRDVATDPPLLDDTRARARLGLVAQADDTRIVFFRAGTNVPDSLRPGDFEQEYAGEVFLVAPRAAAIKDPDALAGKVSRAFGFRWFVPELLKHRRVWRDVLIASLVIQVLALAAPVFTQIVIDKVVVHRTQSTLVVIAVGMGVFTLFSALLTWVRQYLVLHTGNRVDAVLGAVVFDHVLKLPMRYFEARPTGVITARLRGVETIREFIASAAVTLILDLPFLLIFVAIMLAYSVPLTLITLAVIGTIIVLSLVVAPIFRERLNEQFLIGARNQAFTTEYVAGLETVKSLQMEPQVGSRYNDYLAEYLRAGFGVRQIANTYNVLANALEQALMLLILVVGALYVMKGSDFTIGMLVAFQMFASRVSQPMLRMVGLWQQFQQANLSVARLGDIMNAPAEPYSVVPNRAGQAHGRIEVENLSFRYGERLPYLFQGLSLSIEPGRVIAIMGPSGCGKSTLAKILQGMYLPTAGRIRIDGTDILHLAANELRRNFGVVPQETVLFSGTVYDNLLMASPHATFEQIVEACRLAEIHEFIEKLPQGYQTEIGERGVGLSGGQKQRLAIARALLKQPKVLIFDEATSSLDQPTAEHFCATINRLKGRVTMLFITHALPRNLALDHVVHLESTPTSSEPARNAGAAQLVIRSAA